MPRSYPDRGGRPGREPKGRACAYERIQREKPLFHPNRVRFVGISIGVEPKRM